MEGRLLGNRYELLEQIGGGGMAIVYKAKCTLLKRYVAVKILRQEFINDEEFVKRFRIEAQAAASLSHPNIVSIYDVGQEDNIHYIVMEYINGDTLKEYIRKQGVVDWKEAVNIAAQICSAIEHAHKNHIIHRDIKPHNIIITKDRIAKVTDFGIARAVSSSTITMAGSTIGSVHYSSPEQARGGFIDEKSDLYSLGVALYEMVTGKIPFDGESPVTVALKHIQDEPQPPMIKNPDIPSGLNEIILKAMMKEQNKRYQSATEFLSDLNTVIKEPYADYAKGSMTESPTIKMAAINVKDLDKPICKEEDREKKRDKTTIWLAVFTSILVLGIFGYIAYKVVMPSMFPDESFVVSDFVGKNIDEVQAELKELKEARIEVKENRVPDETVLKNIIMTQSIDAGQSLKPGSYSTLILTISDGPEMATIPDLKNKDLRIAEATLKNLKLKLTEPVEEYNDTVGDGLVIRTEPEIGTEVKVGTEVTIFKSMGPELKEVPVPNLIGLTRAEAKQKIIESNLTLGSLFPEGTVSDVAKIEKQEPAAGSSVLEGTKVDLYFEEETVSNGTQLQRKSKAINLVLLDPDRYGDRIEVTVETVPSDTLQPEVAYNKIVDKSDFPVGVMISIPVDGSAEVTIYYDKGLAGSSTEK